MLLLTYLKRLIIFLSAELPEAILCFVWPD